MLLNLVNEPLNYCLKLKKMSPFRSLTIMLESNDPKTMYRAYWNKSHDIRLHSTEFALIFKHLLHFFFLFVIVLDQQEKWPVKLEFFLDILSCHTVIIIPASSVLELELAKNSDAP